MGEFNANVGVGDPAKSYIGPYGLGSRNTRGISLINFAKSHQLKITNTFFNNRRWAWISPNCVTHNEIDNIPTYKPLNFTHVSVINSFNTGCDDPMIRGSMTVNAWLERARLIKRSNKATAVAISAKAT